MSKVNIYKCNDYNEDEVKAIMDKIIAFYDELKDIKEGTRVVIKANLVSAMAPEKGATTHPLLIKVLTDYLIARKCSVTVGDSPGGVFTSMYLKNVYKATKMDTTGAKLNDNFNTKKVSYPDAKVLKTFEYTSYLDDADLIINISKLKTHGMMGMSASVKNLFGTIPGTLKPEYHYRFPNHEDFAQMLIDLNEYFKPGINIIDGIIGMEGNGPTAGTPKKANIVLSSPNPYELDYIASKIMGLNPMEVPTIKVSIDNKLCNPDLIMLNDNLDNYLIKDYELIKSGSLWFMNENGSFLQKIVAKITKRLFANKPEAQKSKCIGCGKCAKVCPAKAITMESGKPRIDRSKCIKCYCCQEFCPVSAMKVKTSFIMKMLHKGKKS